VTPVHRHVWKIVSQTTQESPVETLCRLGAAWSMTRGTSQELTEATAIPVIVKARCEVCGTERVYRV
jgi:hypothetical protein